MNRFIRKSRSPRTSSPRTSSPSKSSPSKSSPSKRSNYRSVENVKTPLKPRSQSTKGFTDRQLKTAGVSTEAQARNLIETFEDVASSNAMAASPNTEEVPIDIEMGVFDGKPVPMSLVNLIEYVTDVKFKESWRIACWIHSNYKHEVYTGAYLSALRELNATREKLDMKVDNFEIPKEDKWRMLSDDTELNALMDVANQFKVLADHCRLKARNLESSVSVATLTTSGQSLGNRLNEFRKELKNFAHKSMQHEISDFVAKLLLAFFQNPYFPRSKFFSFMFVGPPGTGKTTIAKDISKVLVTSGLFEGGFYDKGKSDFIGQYLGQTPHITKKTLTTCALEGVLFIDEAYSLCNKDKDGRIDMYGSEFATTLVDFMTRFKGLNCIITAGYEPEMKAQFLAANDGLPRRFPHRFLLNDLDTKQLSGIVDSYNRDLLRPNSKEEQTPFTKDASDMVRFFIDEVRAKKSTFPHLYRLIENQAGSASNIAEFISTFTLGQKSNRYFKAKQGVLSEDSIRDVIDGSKINIGPGDVIAALRAIVSQAEMSNRKKALKELDKLFHSDGSSR